jgi:glycosyltransferase involved in cell wall biosynthesis
MSNGYSDQYYKNIDFSKKTNSMVWSSSLARGFADFYEYVVQPILKEVPDFKLYVCSGTIAPTDYNLLNRAKYLPGVKVLNTLSKEELANLQRTAKIWIYPGVFPETFCITAVENANAGNIIISPLSYGLSTTLDNINYLKEWNLPILNKENASLFVEKALTALKNNDYGISLAIECLNSCKEYNWDRAAKEIVDMIENDNITPYELEQRAKEYCKLNL